MSEQSYENYQHADLNATSIEVPSHWILGRVKYVSKNLDYLRIPLSSEERSYKHGDIPYYGASGIIDHVDEHIFEDENVLVSEDGANLLARSSPIAFLANGKYWVNNHAHILTFVDGLNKYWAYVIEDMDVSTSVTGSAQPKLTAEALGELEVAFSPASDERLKIANFLDHETAKIDTLIEKQQQLIKLLKEKRQAVISHAVTKGLNPDAPMKDSGVEWLGEVPAGWDVQRLKTVIESGSSISYGIVQPGERLEHGVPFIQTTNISSGSFDIEDLHITSSEIASNFPRSKLVGGEVILGIRASIGAAYVVPQHLNGVNLSRGIARIVPGAALASEFLVDYLRSGVVTNYWGLASQGSTFSEVSIETVRELYVVIPKVEEQLRIHEYIETACLRYENLIDNAENLVVLQKERRTALISAAVTGKIDVRNWQPPEYSSTSSMDA